MSMRVFIRAQVERQAVAMKEVGDCGVHGCAACANCRLGQCELFLPALALGPLPLGHLGLFGVLLEECGREIGAAFVARRFLALVLFQVLPETSLQVRSTWPLQIATPPPQRQAWGYLRLNPRAVNHSLLARTPHGIPCSAGPCSTPTRLS